jgi:predicted ATPase
MCHARLVIYGSHGGVFFGRAADLAQLEKLLAEEGALVTVVGPPGVGKTRLALELVQRQASLDHLICDLAEVRTTEGLLARLAEALHVGAERARLQVRVGDALAEREGLLLVLDNVEPVIEVAVSVLGALRRAAPRTRWLATSRIALGMRGEWRHELAPLATRGDDSDASCMLADRVTRTRGSPPPRTELEVLARIAERLDGLPLALELAASRVAAIGARAVEQRLEQQLDLLTQGPRDLDPRQRTLRGAIAWSWDLLGTAERRVLAQLSVFCGGFDLEAAEAVAVGSSLDVVQALRERSLLYAQADESGEMRFGLYMSIREFAAGELAADDAVAATDRHARYYAHLVEQARKKPARLLANRDNIFAAVERCIQRSTPDSVLLAARLLLGLEPLIDRAPLEPYLERLESFLATSAAVEVLAPELRCSVQIMAGRCMRRLGRLHDAKRQYADTLTLARAIGASAVEAHVHGELGMLAFFESRLDEALSEWRTSIAMARELGDERRLALDQTRCGMILRDSGYLEEARQVLGEALAMNRRIGDADALLVSLSEMAQTHLELGELDQCLALIAEAEQVPAPRTLLSEVAIAARTAFADWERGEFARGEVLAERALVLLRHIGYRRVEAGLHFYLAVQRYVAQGSSPARELEWVRRQLEGDPRAVHLTSAWLAHLAIADDPERARAGFAALAPLRPGDPWSVVSTILRLPLELSGVALVARAQELAAQVRSLDVRLACRVVERKLVPARERSSHGLLEVAPDGDSFSFEGTRHSLTRYRTLRRLLLRLVESRHATPGVALAWDQLFAVGWPGERAQAESARNRLKVAISTLRSMGLRDKIIHDGNGYLLAPTIEVRVVPHD